MNSALDQLGFFLEEEGYIGSIIINYDIPYNISYKKIIGRSKDYIFTSDVIIIRDQLYFDFKVEYIAYLNNKETYELQQNMILDKRYDSYNNLGIRSIYLGDISISELISDSKLAVNITSLIHEIFNFAEKNTSSYKLEFLTQDSDLEFSCSNCNQQLIVLTDCYYLFKFEDSRFNKIEKYEDLNLLKYLFKHKCVDVPKYYLDWIVLE